MAAQKSGPLSQSSQPSASIAEQSTPEGSGVGSGSATDGASGTAGIGSDPGTHAVRSKKLKSGRVCEKVVRDIGMAAPKRPNHLFLIQTAGQHVCVHEPETDGVRV
jgi:hypothetical protein